MKIKLRFILISIIILVASIICVLYGRIKLKHVNYDEYIKSSKYTYFSTNIYDFFPELENIIIKDDEVNNAQDLINLSDYVLLIETFDKPMLHGKDIVNNCIIKKIIKGKGLNIGNKIQIYDLVMDWDMNSTGYFPGFTPLKMGEQYIVFLKKAPKPTIKNTYLFSSIKFGHIITSKQSQYVLGYDIQTLKLEDMFKIEEAQNYDYIFTKDYTDDDVKKYEKIVKEIYELVK